MGMSSRVDKIKIVDKITATNFHELIPTTPVSQTVIPNEFFLAENSKCRATNDSISLKLSI